jgi:hypothetical protein
VKRGVQVEAAGARLPGALDLPGGARGLVIFASNQNLGRIDPRQVNLARALNRRGLGTLLFDLVENSDGTAVTHDVERLTERLLGATLWVSEQWGVDALPLGYVCSALGSAAALSAAAILGAEIGAVSSRAGRPDLATEDMRKVRAPTLLVVDPDDSTLMAANVGVAAQLRCPHRLRKVPGDGRQAGAWTATPAICRWMEWHLGSPEVPYEPRLALG